MKLFFDKFGSLKGAKFIGLKNYTNKYGEVAIISLLTNINVKNAKENDLQKLKAVTDDDLTSISKKKNLSLDVLKTALSELIASAEKNLSENVEDRTAGSKAQADAYIHLSPSVRLHKDTMNVYVTGFINSKTVIVEGEYPETKKREKTLCKEAIKKHADLRMEKFRNYKVGSMDEINITGSTLQVL